jgi:CO dehydrogenase maturation factor
VVGNKIRSEKDRESLVSSMSSFEFLGFIPYDESIVEADLTGLPLVDSSEKVMSEVEDIVAKILGPTLYRTVKNK